MMAENAPSKLRDFHEEEGKEGLRISLKTEGESVKVRGLAG